VHCWFWQVLEDLSDYLIRVSFRQLGSFEHHLPCTGPKIKNPQPLSAEGIKIEVPSSTHSNELLADTRALAEIFDSLIGEKWFTVLK
jgi:hypothetical protein